MLLKKVVTAYLLDKCRRFLAQKPTINVLTLGDCYSPLFEKSTLHAAIEGSQIVGVSSVYHALSKPSIVLAASTNEIKNALLKTSLKEVSNEFISICEPEEIEIFTGFSGLLSLHLEQQMIANPPKKIRTKSAKVVRVNKVELINLDKFYRKHQTEAWAQLQFSVGPFFCIKHNGKIVSAAGTHVKTPQIAHLGNIVTDEAYRNRGFASACTSVLARNLSSKGRIISLFVRADNASAIRVYKRIGFEVNREIAFITAQKTVK